MSRGWIFGIALYAHVAPLAIYVSREMQIDEAEPVKPVHVELRASTVHPWRDPCEPRPAFCDHEEVLQPECVCPKPERSIQRPIGPRFVPPSLLHRLSGQTDIPPPDDVRAGTHAAGKTTLLGAFKMCVDTRGEVSHVSLLKSTGYSGYDLTLSNAIRSWRYAPFVDHGTPIDVCTAITFRITP